MNRKLLKNDVRIDKKFNQITCTFINEPQQVDHFSFSVMEKENNNNQCNVGFNFLSQTNALIPEKAEFNGVIMIFLQQAHKIASERKGLVRYSEKVLHDRVKENLHKAFEGCCFLF